MDKIERVPLGPWRILGDDEREIDGAEVCTVPSFSFDALTIVAAENDEDPLPRAHLIAAAPDLYAALTAILQTYDDGGVALTDAFSMANAALAKARGES